MNPVLILPATSRLRRPLGIASILVAFGLASFFAGCGEDSSTPAAPAPAPAPPPAPTPPPPPPEPETATYTFAQPVAQLGPRVPGSLPDGVDFAFPLAMIAHPRDAAPWTLGETASDGLKLLAETGASAALVAEAEAAGMDVIATNLGEFLQIFLSPDPSIEMHLERPCLTYAQAIAPSSDWFIGLSNACATDEDGRWLDGMSVDVIAHDAGTAEGEDFMVKSVDTEPREPITVLDAPPYLAAPAVAYPLTATRKEE